jgi:hypothetical protein
VSLGELPGLHIGIIQQRQHERWSILLLTISTGPKREFASELGYARGAVLLAFGTIMVILARCAPAIPLTVESPTGDSSGAAGERK